jgi:hypothetical protein
MRFPISVIAFSMATATAAAAPPASRAPVCAKADSARLAMPKGVALVSRGGSFFEIHDGAELIAGDRLLIRGGSASLFGPDAALIRAGAGSLLTLERRDGLLCVARVSSHPDAAASASSGKECDKDESERDPAKCPPIPPGGAPGGAGLPGAGAAGGPLAGSAGGVLAGSALPVLGGVAVAGAVAGGVAAGTSSTNTDKNALPKISPQ